MENRLPVTVIVVSYNTRELTRKALASIYSSNILPAQVIVVDNNSEDDSISKINEYCKGNLKIETQYVSYDTSNKPIEIFEFNERNLDEIKEIKIPELPLNQKLILLKLKENYGFAGGNNFGIKLALKYLDAHYVLLLNNDTVVDPDFLSELVKVAESDVKIGFVGPKTYYYDNENLIQTTGGCRIDLNRAEPTHVDLEEYDHGQYDKELNIDYISGACLLCKREVIEEIGLMDEAHFMYWEETDWCFRGLKYGYKSAYSYKSRIWHKVGKSSQTPFKIYYHNRNRVYFMKKNANKYHMAIYMLYLFIIYFWFMTGVYLVYRMDKEKFMSFYRGIRDGLNLKPHIERI